MVEKLTLLALLFLLSSCTSDELSIMKVYDDPAYPSKKRNCDIALSHLHDKKFHMQQCGGNIIVY